MANEIEPLVTIGLSQANNGKENAESPATQRENGRSRDIELLEAVRANNIEELERLVLRRQVDVNVCDTEGQTALHLAAFYNLDRVIVFLIDHGANTEALMTPLHIAAWKGNTEATDALLMKGAKVNAVTLFGSALHYAAYGGHSDVAQLLVVNGANLFALEDSGRPPYKMATTKVLRKLLKGEMTADTAAKRGFKFLQNVLYLKDANQVIQ